MLDSCSTRGNNVRYNTDIDDDASECADWAVTADPLTYYDGKYRRSYPFCTSRWGLIGSFISVLVLTRSSKQSLRSSPRSARTSATRATPLLSPSPPSPLTRLTLTMTRRPLMTLPRRRRRVTLPARERRAMMRRVSRMLPYHCVLAL